MFLDERVDLGFKHIDDFDWNALAMLVPIDIAMLNVRACDRFGRRNHHAMIVTPLVPKPRTHAAVVGIAVDAVLCLKVTV